MRRALLPAILGLVCLSCAVAGVRVQPPGAVAEVAGAAPAPAPPPVEAPVLSPRRVPALLAQPIGRARLVQELDGIAAASPDACLLVTEGDRVLFERQSDRPLVPASGMKLLTAAAVLHHLDPGERLRTEVLAAAAPAGGVVEGDLWLVGGGDPLLGTAAWAAHLTRQPALFTPLDVLADRIVEAGVREVRGRVVGDETRYDASRYVASWPERYIVDNQIGPLSALSVNDGFEQWEPRDVPFVDPATGAAGVLTELLRQRGVVVAGGAASGPAPNGAATVAAIDSPSIAELVGQMLRESDNGTAELLVKELGLQVAGEGTTAAGTNVVAATVSSLGLAGEGLVVRDGSGLDPANQVTCRLLHGLLDATDEGGAIDTGLAVAGTTGTLSQRFLGTPVQGQVRAKTGSIRGVASLSGFASSRGGFEFTFSSILNGVDRFDEGVPLQDALAAALVRYPDLPDLEEIGPSGYPAAA